MKAGSLFTGTAALDMAAAELFGTEWVWLSEYEPPTKKNRKPAQAAARLLAHHLPDVPNLGDITAIDWDLVEPVDILTAGFPCQDVSVAGKRAGMKKGTRTGLWSEVVRAIATLKPKFVLLENVPGLRLGEWNDEPNDRCVCGWAYRRGGLHRDCREERRVLAPHRRGNDDQSASGAGSYEGSVRRDDLEQQGRNGAMGCGDLLGADRGAGSGDAAEIAALPTAEGGAGARGDSRRGDPAGSSSAEGHACVVDGRGQDSVRDAEDADARAEPERSFDPATGEPVSECPFCGRDLGDRPIRSVFRSGASAVLGDLACLRYLSQWVSLPASAVGAPHQRERFFLLAVADAEDERHERPRAARRRRAGSPDRSDTAADAGRARPQGSEPARGRDVSARRAVADSDGCGRGADQLDDAARKRDAARRGQAAADADGGQLAGNPERDVRSEGGLAAPQRDDADGRVLEWAGFEPAIRRWEAVLGRPAPAPTTVGARGGDVLNPALVEWMMGLPDGWITSVPGLTRAQQIKLGGNGVVRQQAVAAFRYLLDVLEHDASTQESA